MCRARCIRAEKEEIGEGQLLPPAPANDIERVVSEALLSVSSPTRRSYSRGLRVFLAWSGGRLDRSTVQAWIAERREVGDGPSSIAQALAAIKLLTREVRERSLLDHGTAESILSIPGITHRGVRSGNWLTRDQAKALIDAPDAETLIGVRDRAVLSLLIGCALRRDELARLVCGHVTMKSGRPVIENITGKGDKTRSMAIPWRRWPFTHEFLDEWLQAAEIVTGRVLRGVNKGGAVCGSGLSGMGIWRVVKRYATVIGVPDLAPHDLRRTHTKLARGAGAKLEQIQDTLGHSSIATTQRYLGTAIDFEEASCDFL